MSEEEPNEFKTKEPIMWFGRDIRQVPCFRNSFLYGIYGGVIGGLAYFLFTSKPRMSSHVGVGSFGVCTLSYWSYCRYKRHKYSLPIEEWKTELQNKRRKEILDIENDTERK